MRGNNSMDNDLIKKGVRIIRTVGKNTPEAQKNKPCSRSITSNNKRMM